MKNTLKDLNVFLHPKQKAILNNRCRPRGK